MGALGRFFGSRDDVPEWASFFSAAEYRAFVAAVEAELGRRGLGYETGDGTIVIQGQEGAFGLQNLAQVCHGTPRKAWAGRVSDHFDSIFRSAEETREMDRKAETLEGVRSQLKVRLYPPDSLDEIGADRLVHRRPAEGLVETLVYDMPGSVRSVPREHVEKWGCPVADLFEAGVENLKAEGRPESKSIELPEGGSVRALIGDSFFVASHALFLEDYLEPVPEHGAVVSVPHRHAVLYHPIEDLRVVHAINAMIRVTFGMYREGPGSISPHLYWWREGRFVLLPSKVTAQSVTFSPPEAFVSGVLNRLPES